MCSPSPPPPPDYTGAAQAQGQANLQAARLTTQLNRPNQVTPWGTQTWTQGGTTPSAGSTGGSSDGSVPSGPTFMGYDDSGNPIYSDSSGGGGTTTNGSSPYSNQDQWTSTITLSPTQQALFDSQNKISQSLADTATQNLDRVGQAQAQPFDTSHMPGISYGPGQYGYQANGTVWNPMVQGGFQGTQLQNGIQGTQLQNGFQGTNVQQGVNGAQFQNGFQGTNVQQGVNGAQFQNGFQGTNVQNNIDTSHVQGLPSDLGGLQNQATNAAMARQNQQLDQQQEALSAQLANQGITPGSDAYNRAMQPLQQARVDATNQAFLTGTQYENQLYNQGLNTNAQQFNQAATQGNFANSAAAQQYAQNQGLAAFNNQAQLDQFNTGLAQGQFANSAAGQQFNQNQAQAAFGNQAQLDQFNTGLQQGQFANQAAGQQYAQNQGQAAFANQAANDQFAQNAAQGQFANQAAGQQFGQNQAQAQFANQAVGQQYQQNMGAQSLYNQAQAQNYNQAMNSSQFQNQALQQAIQQQAYLRQLPLNELNALRTGSQVTAPQFTQYSNGGQVQAAPIFAAAQAQGQAAQQNYQNQVGASNGLLGGLFGLGGSLLSGAGAAGSFGQLFSSDRRLKRNISRIGTTASGLPWYSFDYIWGEPAEGVMADEVEKVNPAAVIRHPNGFAMVDYGRI